jgi:hypothetical protein
VTTDTTGGACPKCGEPYSPIPVHVCFGKKKATLTAEEQAAMLTLLAEMPHESLVVEYVQLQFERDCAVEEMARVERERNEWSGLAAQRNAAIAEIATERDQLGKLAIFGRMVLEESRDSLGDLDGGWLQDTAVKCGLLKRVEATESCGDSCRCVEFDDFPTNCYRYTEAAHAVKVTEGSSADVPAPKHVECYGCSSPTSCEKNGCAIARASDPRT